MVQMFPVYCSSKHKGQSERTVRFEYGGKTFEVKVSLCSECFELFSYALERLRECPHDPKPRCRKCPDPCYEPDKYRAMAKVMAYASVRLGLSKAKRKIKGLFRKD